MQNQPIICPVEYVKKDFPFTRQELQPVLDFLYANQPLPALDLPFPVGTVTADGRLDMCKRQLGIEGIQLVTNALKHNHTVKHILLGTNAFGNTGATAVADMLKVNSTVETVYLGCNYIEDEGCAAICEALEQNQTVKSTWFKRNPVGQEGIAAVIQLLSKNPYIRTLDLVNVGAGAAFPALLEALAHNRSLERLYLSGNYLTADDMRYVNTLLLHNRCLKALYLSVNDIGDEGIANLKSGLMANSALEELSLASCGITESGLTHLLNALGDNRCLHSLDLGYAPSTRVLGAKANSLTGRSADKLAGWITSQKQLVYLNVTRTELPEVGKVKIYNAILEREDVCVVMDGYPAKKDRPGHPDSMAIKSVYR